MIPRRDTTSTTDLPHDHSGTYCPACDALKEASKAALLKWDEQRRKAGVNVAVEAVLALHAQACPIGGISRATGLSDAETRFVIQRGRMPQKTLTAENGVAR